ncbi:MAG: PDZ domain-containing protein [Deltaproteobacteria bacterium]|nr:PDZ domain-containing protein [Deltaproteobacteria bacterium]
MLGDSNQLEQGEPVLAIGNPFGLSETVTTGIVSATGRVIGAGPYDNFIQTDASINPGNSGGPLFNYSGEVVGINAAIVASGQGIGFAVPINTAKEILLQLKDKGRVTRGWLGVTIQNVTPELAKSFKLEEEKGALVADVSESGPASKAGIQRGDVIVEFNGQPVENSQVLPQMVAGLMPGTDVDVKVIREGKTKMFKVKLETLEEETMAASETTQRARLGITIQTVTPELAKGLGMESAQGVAITSVEPGSPAADAGLRRGDVVLEVDQKPVNTVDEFKEATSDISSKPALMLVWRQGSTYFVTLQTK